MTGSKCGIRRDTERIYTEWSAEAAASAWSAVAEECFFRAG